MCKIQYLYIDLFGSLLLQHVDSSIIVNSIYVVALIINQSIVMAVASC